MITKIPLNLTQKYKFRVVTHSPSLWSMLAQPLVQV